MEKVNDPLQFSNEYYNLLKVANAVFGDQNVRAIGGGRNKETKEIYDPHILVYEDGGRAWSLNFKHTHFINLFLFVKKNYIQQLVVFHWDTPETYYSLIFDKAIEIITEMENEQS